ncbi:uncharacterized protein LOC134218422 [Armigeres subalbatus]|uniref:uncharacterized protein LOC134218422 n=1 Tax=Armigeres subalbatus TaxID=124917 RepID=UPI002ED1D662
MLFSQEEVVECSQKPSRGSKSGAGRKRFRNSVTQRQTRSSKANALQHRSGSGTAEACEIPESATENSAANLSGSLFSGQQDLLKQYEAHDDQIRKRDEVLEQVLEQSRKAYEQLKLQTQSASLFSAEDGTLGRKEVGLNTDLVEKGEIAIQTTPIKKDSRNFGAQIGSEKAAQKDIAVQFPPNSVDKRTTRDAEVQSSSPGFEKKRIKTADSAVNTTFVLQEDATVQTNPVEQRNVGVQKYHSTRVREIGNQTSPGRDQLNRSVGKRNVCVQQRSSGMLELNREAALVLGIELKCDPTRLQRSLLRVAARQCSTKDADGNETGEQQVEFTDEDPYWANYGHFMDDVVDDGATASDSGLGEIEPQMSCCIEESIG